ncbi:Ysc84 actin-binding domain protein [Ascosphaera apis ARSEF 7405]|uniref:Ysc84 actin-binding domain protein n=1 Tax=Ascosphaera apis ARSEF 7405 TaxID=392613 RepID=A0A167W101_9EURO|nr:Ysc84 actin-binding domain protein [Ascosphaera apis ARSEF 7405]
MPPTNWEKTKTYSKKGFDAAWGALDKLGNPVNKLSNKIGSESFWPTTLDKESEKAARILRSFCKDGFYAQVDADAEKQKKPGESQPQGKQRVLKKIPAEVIREAKGLAIFTVMRTGFWISGAGGSGILIARVPETGEWSPPSGIMLHTAGLGFLIGVDIYDCVVVINDYKALDAFKKVRCTLGGEVSAVAGPVGVGGMVDSEVHKRRAPIWTYLKSRGFYAGVQVDGTIVIERTDENERFYGARYGVEEILGGKIKNPPRDVAVLINTIKAAQGDTDYDESLLAPPGAPGDFELEADTFAIPDPDDPDPYGVKALEQEGIVIREAGTKSIPSMEAFEFRPSEKSPIYKRWSGVDSRRGSWRTSVVSTNSVDRGTQTDDLPPYPGSASISYRSRSSSHNFAMSPIPLDDEEEEDGEKPQAADAKADATGPTSPSGSSFSRARMVIIPKRAPPPLPPRNPERFAAMMEQAQRENEAASLAERTLAEEEEEEEEEEQLERVASSEHHDVLKFSSHDEIAEELNNERREWSEDHKTVEALISREVPKIPGAPEDAPITTRLNATHGATEADHDADPEKETDDDFHSIAGSLDVAQDEAQHRPEPEKDSHNEEMQKAATEGSPDESYKTPDAVPATDDKKETDEEHTIVVPHSSDAEHPSGEQEVNKETEEKASDEAFPPLTLPEDSKANDDHKDEESKVSVDEVKEPVDTVAAESDSVHPAPANADQEAKADDKKEESSNPTVTVDEKETDGAAFKDIAL